MRILDKYLYKELYATFFAVLAVLLLITFGTEATKLLAIAVEGQMPSSILFQVLLLKIPPALEVILPLVALLSVMLAIGRLYQDQEMVVLNACSVSPAYFQKIIFIFILPLAFFTGWVSLWLTPWSYQTERQLMVEAQETAPIAGLVAGKFNELPNNAGVFYAQEISSNAEFTQVWIKLNREQQEILLTAPKGRFIWKEQQLTVELFNGFLYQLDQNGQQTQVQKYGRFEGDLPQIKVAVSAKERKEKWQSELWNSEGDKDLAMANWRLVVPFSVLVMGLMGLKMSKTAPREGRFAKIFLALLVYVIFNQLLLSSNEMVRDGSLTHWVGSFPVILFFLWYAFSKFTFSSLWNAFSIKALFSRQAR